jgi:hypothetical protein
MRSPSWSDANEHDPGITLVALLAWLAVGLLLARRLVGAIGAHRPRQHAEGAAGGDRLRPTRRNL